MQPRNGASGADLKTAFCEAIDGEGILDGTEIRNPEIFRCFDSPIKFNQKIVEGGSVFRIHTPRLNSMQM